MVQSRWVEGETCLQMIGSIRSKVDRPVRGDSPAPNIRQITAFASSGKEILVMVLVVIKISPQPKEIRWPIGGPLPIVYPLRRNTLRNDG